MMALFAVVYLGMSMDVNLYVYFGLFLYFRQKSFLIRYPSLRIGHPTFITIPIPLHDPPEKSHIYEWEQRKLISTFKNNSEQNWYHRAITLLFVQKNTL